MLSLRASHGADGFCPAADQSMDGVCAATSHHRGTVGFQAPWLKDNNIIMPAECLRSCKHRPKRYPLVWREVSGNSKFFLAILSAPVFKASLLGTSYF